MGSNAAPPEKPASVRLPPGSARVRVVEHGPRHVTLEAQDESGRPIGTFAAPASDRATTPLERLKLLWNRALTSSDRLLSETASARLMGVALVIYLAVRLIGLADYPIYFFTDEAIQTTLAADLVRDHGRGYDLDFLPTYFENGGQYNLSLSVYAQVLPYLLFGKSVWVTRGTSALLTFLAALSVAGILRRIFRSRIPWLGVLLLSATPAWFLHSRTAFETALGVTFYAAFLYFYLLYRQGNPRAIYLAVAAGAATFYAYAPMRAVIGVAALLLFLTDLPYHLSMRRSVLPAFGLAILLALPFFRFLFLHPGATTHHLDVLGSYWMLDWSVGRKLLTFLSLYFQSLDPLYWYAPHSTDLPRHVMGNYAHLTRFLLPFGLLGVGLAIRFVRKAEWRVLLLALLCVPAGAAMVGVGITRLLALVIPMAILTALALEQALGWLARRRIPPGLLAGGMLVFGMVGNFSLLNDALTNGPTWSTNYGLHGMQYGASQVFGAIQGYLKSHPDAKAVLSPTWANGTDVVARFFMGDDPRLELNSPQAYTQQIQPIQASTLFVITPEEFRDLPRELFATIDVVRTLPWPDGRPGFYFLHLAYAPDAAARLSTLQEQKRALVEDEVTIQGIAARLLHTRFDMNKAAQLFDGNTIKAVRSAAVNPMLLDFSFPQPFKLQSIVLRIGGTATTAQAELWQAGVSEPLVRQIILPESHEPRDLTLDFNQPLEAVRLRLSIANTNDPPDGHVHVWEITFR